MFTTPLRVEIIGEQLFKLTDSLIYEDSKYHIEILEGFVFDGGSIPKWLWGIVDSPIGGVGSSAFCLHDVLYATQFLEKEEADELLYQCLIDTSMPLYKSNAIYKAVDLLGQEAYDKIESKTQYWEFVKLHSK